MSRRPYTFRERDLTRAMRAAAKSGVPYAGVKIDRDGCIVVMNGEPVPAPANDAESNPWDKLVS